MDPQMFLSFCQRTAVYQDTYFCLRVILSTLHINRHIDLMKALQNKQVLLGKG